MSVSFTRQVHTFYTRDERMIIGEIGCPHTSRIDYDIIKENGTEL